MAKCLVKKTNRYATCNRNKPEFSIFMEKIMQFIGLIYLSAYNIRLSERDYWSTDPDLRCNAFCKTMSGNRFFEIKAVLHVANNQCLTNCRMAKVKPLYDILNEKLIPCTSLGSKHRRVNGAILWTSLMQTVHQRKTDSFRV